MLFFLGLVWADCFKIAAQDKYMGISGNELLIVDEGHAVNFLRKHADLDKYFTNIMAPDGRSIGFSGSNVALLTQEHSHNKIIIALDLNGKYVLIHDEMCFYTKGDSIMRGDCSKREEVSYFEITPCSAHEMHKRELIKVAEKTDGYNPQDPLAVEPGSEDYNPADTERILMPYRERLAGSPQIKVPPGVDGGRILAKFNIL